MPTSRSPDQAVSLRNGPTVKPSVVSTILLTVTISSAAGAQMGGGAPSTTPAEKIRSAMNAGPAQITANARILDWPAVRGGKPVELRTGTNGWVCYPRTRADVDNSMCLDPVFQEWLDAYKAKRAPRLSGIGVAYGLGGGYTGSAKDPFATAKTPDNDWGSDPPGLMIISPDSTLYAGFPTKRSSGVYVMFAGTPYAHLMVPVGARK